MLLAAACSRTLSLSFTCKLSAVLHGCAQMRYANNSNYKNDTMIRKEAFVSAAVLLELKRIIEDSEVRHCLSLPPTPAFPLVAPCVLCAALGLAWS